MPRWVSAGVRLAGWAILLLCFVCPVVALVERGVREGFAGGEALTFSERQWGLLWRSLWLSASATLVSLAISLPFAFLLGRAEGALFRSSLLAILLSVVLCPPMVYAFGWARILPRGLDPHLGCILVWSMWTFPIPSLILAAGWSRGGRGAYEAALLATGAAGAFLHVGAPALRRHIALSVFILFVVFFGDYGVPHAWGLLVYATELLGWALNSPRILDVLLPAWPGMLFTLFFLGAAVWFWRGCASGDVDAARMQGRGSTVLGIVGAIGVTAALAVPVWGLILRMPAWDAFGGAVRTYGMDMAASYGVSVAAGVASVVLGVGTVGGGFSRSVAVTWSVVFGALPGALIGSALIAAYNRPGVGWMYDHWPIVVLGAVARFGWIGVLTAAAVNSTRFSDLGDQAKVDGADAREVFSRVLAPMNRAVFAAAAAVIAVLALAEIPTTTLVRVPTFNPLSLTLIEKFHKMEDGMLVSLSFCMMGVAVPTGAVLFWGLRRRR